MDERKKKVLQAIVLDYIASAEPVGSRTIARNFNLGVSPATIRNEMSDLEDMGLIEQPHTSAGRIPSDSGYRYYVDCLMQKPSLGEDEKAVVEEILFQKIRKMQNLIQETSKLLSNLTNLTSVVISPRKGSSAFSQVHLLPYQPGKALMVVVKENGAVENQVIDIAENTTPEELQRVSAMLNNKLRGLNLEQLKSSLLRELYSELTRQKDLITMALEVLEPILDPKEEDGVVLGGTINMLNQPEFQNIDKLKNLLKIFEESSGLKRILTQENSSGLTVRIGGENKLEEMHDCSLVTASYHLDGQVVGVIGVLGPTRMDYAKVSSLVEFMTDKMSLMLGKYYKK